LTGLPMTVWITENDSYRHDMRVKVGTHPAAAAIGLWGLELFTS
jgi:hypothetical protein